MKRRAFNQILMTATLAGFGSSPLWAQSRTAPLAPEIQMAIENIEKKIGGRIGLAVAQGGTDATWGYRADERFAMCSTFKWLAAAHVLHEVDVGKESLSRSVPYGPEVLLPWSPITERHADGAGMTVGQLCHAAITISDNAAGNLLLRGLGGPAALTAFVRAQGDTVTRLDRWEPELNEALPADPRDTTSPRAMALLLRHFALEQGLSAQGRTQLVQWLRATTTNARRLGAVLPKGWFVGSKTGTGQRGNTSDVGIYWPDDRPPIGVAIYIADCDASLPARESAIAEVAGWVVRPMA